jgi:hypothetical protein
VRLLADHCDLYNAALQERREAWRRRNLSVSYGDQSAQLKETRAAKGRARKIGYPRFKPYRRFDQVLIVATESEPVPLPSTGRPLGSIRG